MRGQRAECLALPPSGCSTRPSPSPSPAPTQLATQWAALSRMPAHPIPGLLLLATHVGLGEGGQAHSPPTQGDPEDLRLSPWPWAPQTPWAPQKDKWLMLWSDQDQKPRHPTHPPWGWVQAVSTALCAAPFPRLRCGLPCPAPE